MYFIIVFWFYFGLVKCIHFVFAFGIVRPVKRKHTVLYLENFPIENAGYQYRAAKWAELLRKQGYQVDIWTLWEDKEEYERRLQEKPFSRFLMHVMRKRLKQLIASQAYETVIVRRELLMYNDYGNLFFDKLLLKIHPSAILDFDDDRRRAVYKKSERTWYGRITLENRDKFYDSLKLYHRFIVASEYLASLVHQLNPQIAKDVLIMPTCVDYGEDKIKNYDGIEAKESIQLGWIGSNGNLMYLDLIISELNKVHIYQPIELKIISGTMYANKEALFPIHNVAWKLESEIDEMLSFDIGIMPLAFDGVTLGKGGFKLLQYMGLGILPVASAITINEEIIEDGINGFLVKEHQPWSEVLIKVMNNKKVFKELAVAAKRKVQKQYTFEANKEKYIKFLDNGSVRYS